VVPVIDVVVATIVPTAPELEQLDRLPLVREGRHHHVVEPEKNEDYKPKLEKMIQTDVSDHHDHHDPTHPPTTLAPEPHKRNNRKQPGS